MNIYDEDAETGEKTLNTDRARVELRNTSGSSLAETTVRRGQNEIQIATMLDIAESLRILAFEAMTSMGGDRFVTSPDTEEGDVAEEDERDFLVIGDLVILRADPAAGVGVVKNLGVSEGEVWASITPVDEDGEREGEFSSSVRVWQKDLERLRGDERPGPDPKAEVDITLDDLRESETPLEGVATPAEAAALRTDEDEDGEEPVGGYELAEGMTDELDDDFAGDDHSETESAIERLRKLEKPAKKKTTAKKGKK